MKPASDSLNTQRRHLEPVCGYDLVKPLSTMDEGRAGALNCSWSEEGQGCALCSTQQGQEAGSMTVKARARKRQLGVTCSRRKF